MAWKVYFVRALAGLLPTAARRTGPKKMGFFVEATLVVGATITFKNDHSSARNGKYDKKMLLRLSQKAEYDNLQLLKARHFPLLEFAILEIDGFFGKTGQNTNDGATIAAGSIRNERSRF